MLAQISHWALLCAADQIRKNARYYFEEALRILVKEWGVDIAATDSDGNTVLHFPYRGGINFRDFSGLREYWSYGGNPGQLNSKGQTFLHLAHMCEG